MNKKNVKIIIILVIFIILFVIITLFLIKKDNPQKSTNNEKIYYEIKFLEDSIFEMSSTISNSEDWQNLQGQAIVLYNFWDSCILDLNSLNIEKKYLTDFGNMLDNLFVTIQNKDRLAVMNSLSDLYKQVLLYYENLDYDKASLNISYSKYNLLMSKTSSESLNWTITYEYIKKSGEYLLNIIASEDYSKYSQYNINQAYISVKELESIINSKNINVFNVKFNIAIKKVSNI